MYNIRCAGLKEEPSTWTNEWFFWMRGRNMNKKIAKESEDGKKWRVKNKIKLVRHDEYNS